MRRPWLLVLGVSLLFALHNDFWLWNDSRLLLGLPIGLLYHLAYTVIVALAMAVLVKLAWPPLLDDEGRGDAGHGDGR